MNDTERLNKEYRSRVNRTLDYIEAHLDKAMTLEELAAVANFSKFHFGRIFCSIVGETPYQFLLRIRIEKAAQLLLTEKHASVKEIAYRCGFSDISVFSRHFSHYFSESPSHFRKARQEQSNMYQQERNIGQGESNNTQVCDKPVMYLCPQHKTIKWRTNMKTNKSVEVRDLPKMTLAYIRHIGPYKGDALLFERLWGKLCTWAGAKGLLQQPDLKSLVIYHDDPKVTLEDKLRMSVCITVPEDTKVDGEFGKMELEAAKYVIARFEIDAAGFMEAWDWVYGHWFPSSGYQPDDKPCFELYPCEPQNGIFLVDICVPVKPM